MVPAVSAVSFFSVLVCLNLFKTVSTTYYVLLDFFFKVGIEKITRTIPEKIVENRSDLGQREKDSGLDDELNEESKSSDSMHLVNPFLIQRLAVSSLRQSVKSAIKAIIDKNPQVNGPFERIQLSNRQRCSQCPIMKDKKIRDACSSCYRPNCEEHSLLFCVDCVGE